MELTPHPGMFSFSIRALLHKGSSYSRLVSALFGEIRKIEVGVQSFQLSKKSLQRRFSFSFGDSEPEGFLGVSISSGVRVSLQWVSLTH